MKLNMHILLEELADMAPRASIRTSRLERAFDFHSPMVDYRTSAPNLVYNVTAEQLRSMIDAGITPHGSFVCSGTPPQEVLDHGCDIIWLEDHPPIDKLVARMTQIFTAYLQWESSTREAIIRGASLRTLAERAEPIIGRPIWAWDPSFKTIFNVVNESRYRLPDDYFFQSDNSEWNAWMIAQWEEEANKRGGRLLSSRDPFFMPTPAENGLSYRCLCSNLFHGDTRVATLCIDEVGAPLSDRDFVLLDILSGFMSEALSFGGTATRQTAQQFGDPLMALVRSLPVSRAQLDGVRASLGWGPEDECYMVVIEPEGEPYSDRMLSRTAYELCTGIEGMLYAVYGHRLLLAVDASKMNLRFRDLPAEIEKRLRYQGTPMRIGASSLWVGIGKLGQAYWQAMRALQIGKALMMEGCVFFDDVLFYDTVLSPAVQENPAASMPLGLRRLVRYDDQNGTDFVEVVRAFLDCNCSMTAAARAFYAHRNTLAYKVEKAKSVLGSDLRDPDERLLLSLALRRLPTA